MSKRQSLIEKLVLTLHLSVPERQMLGSGPVRFAEVAAVITQSLDETGRFPPNVKTWEVGQIVFEGHFLEIQPNKKVRLWLQRALPVVPCQLADRQHWDFSDANLAVAEFVRREWLEQHRGIDGIEISL